MRRFVAGFAAAGICLFATVSLWTARTGGTTANVADLLASGAVALLSVVLGWLLAARITADPDRRGIIALIVGVWGVAFGTFQILAATHALPVLSRAWVAVPVWTALCGLAILLIARSSAELRFAARVLGIAAVFLLGTQGIGSMRHALAEPAQRSTPVTRERASPDVYVIVLDKYSSGAWLKESYGVDQSAFEDSLRALGFVVPRNARANYAHTQISLATLLNWTYAGHAAQPRSWQAMQRLIAEARAWHVFRERGYRVVAFPTNFAATRDFPQADVELRPPRLMPSRLPLTWLTNSPLAAFARRRDAHGVTPYPVEDLDALEWKLETLASLPDSSGPIFAFMHLLAPHEPYLFNRDCSPRQAWWPLTDQGDNFDSVGAAYADQVRCLAPLLLKTVRQLIERSTVPPVIVLQSDHGHGRIAVDPLRGFTLTAEELSSDRIGDRLGVFAAYRFPGAVDVVGDDISPVNVFPLVLQSLFGDGLGRQPDRSYWSAYQSAFSFTEVLLDEVYPRALPEAQLTKR